MGWFGGKKKKVERPALPPIPSDILAKIRVKGDAPKPGAALAPPSRTEDVSGRTASDVPSMVPETRSEQRAVPSEVSPFAQAIEEMDVESTNVSQPQHEELSKEIPSLQPEPSEAVPEEVPIEAERAKADETPVEEAHDEPAPTMMAPVSTVSEAAYKREELAESDLAPVVVPVVAVPGRPMPVAAEGSIPEARDDAPGEEDEEVSDSVTAGEEPAGAGSNASAEREELTPSASIGSVLNALLSKQSAPDGVEQSDAEPVLEAPTDTEAGPFLQTIPPEVARIAPASRTKGSPNTPQNGYGQQFGRQTPGMGQVAFTNAARRRNGSPKPIESYQGRRRGPAIFVRIFSFLFIFSLIAGALGIGGYFLYLRYREVLFTPVEPVIPILPDPDRAKNDTELPVESVFSVSRPNYLPISVEDVSADEIRKELRSVAERVRGAGLTVPIEFLVSDGNNVPIAFSRFAHLAGLELSEDIISLSDEAFSVFVYVDAGEPRIGLVMTIKPGVPVSDALRRHEPELPQGLRMLMLDGVKMPRGAVYRSGSYDGTVVRYFNIPSTGNLSVDYAIRDNSLYIGTSKDTLRAILDKKK